MALKSAAVVGKNCIELGILAEDNNQGPSPPKTELDAWIAAATTPNTWLLNSAGNQTEIETFFSTGRDTWIIIDLATMKVLEQTQGNALQAIADLQAKCM